MSSEEQPDVYEQGISVISIVNSKDLILRITKSKIGKQLLKVFKKVNSRLATLSRELYRQSLELERLEQEIQSAQSSEEKQLLLEKQQRILKEQQDKLESWFPGVGQDLHTYTLKEELSKMAVVTYPLKQIRDGNRYINREDIKNPTHSELPGIATRATIYYPYFNKFTEEDFLQIKRTVEEILNSGCINFKFLEEMEAEKLEIFIDLYHNRKMSSTWQWHYDLKSLSVFLFLCYINRFSDITSAEFKLNCGSDVDDTILRFNLTAPFNTCYGLNILHSTACNASEDDLVFTRSECKDTRKYIEDDPRTFVRIVGVALLSDGTPIRYSAEEYWESVVCKQFKDPSKPNNFDTLDRYGNYTIELNKPDKDDWINELKKYLPSFTTARLAGGNNKQKRNRKIKIKTRKRKQTKNKKKNKRKQTKNKKKLK